MAKKRKSPTPDENGTLDTGIYRRRILKKRAAFQALREAFTTPRPPLAEWIAALSADLDRIAQSGEPETERDARHAMMHLRAVVGLAAAIDHPKAARLVDEAMMLGELVERIGVRPFEALVVAERGRREGARKAIEIVNEAHTELRPTYQALVDQHVAAGLSYSAACEQVASSLGVSGRTVREHTVNPAPRNRGRQR